MIKENKKNKIITFLCACLMVCASALGLVSAIGTTLASSPTQPTITADYFNYNSSNFLNLFDGVFEGITPYTFGTYVPEEHFFPSPSDCKFRILSGGHTFDQYISNHYVYYYNNNTIYSSSPYYTSDNGSYYTFLLSPGFNNAEFVNNSQLLDIKQDLFVIVIYGDDGIYRTYCSKTAYDYNQVYLNGQNNVVNNPSAFGLYTQAQYQQNYTNGQNSVVNNPSAFGLYTQAQYEQNYTDGYYDGILQGQNNVIDNPNNFGLHTNQDLQNSYNQGFADGEQTTYGYQNGFNDGKNDVLNNPNNYDLYTQAQYEQNYTNGINYVLNNLIEYNLYTQAQYEQNYTDGYNAGVLNSQYGILSNVEITGLVQINDNVTGINNNDFTFNSGTITPNSTLLNKLNTVFNSSVEDYAIAQIRFTLDEQYIYTRDNIINFVNLSLLPNQTSYLPVTYITNSNQTVALVYSFNPIVDNNVFTGYNVGIIGDDTPLLDNTISSFVITYTLTDIDGIQLTRGNLVKPQAISIFANNVAFNNGYNVGYIDGTRSDVVNNAYDRGVVDGFNSGYSQGLANQDNATFASMISAVIDVPINAMRNLFNFELLGINLFGFFTALFTLLVVITIVRLLLGGK